MTYLVDYIEQLESVHDRHGLFSQLLPWQNANHNELMAQAQKLNQAFKFEQPGRQPYMFRNHVATTAVGALGGLLIVAANPGWSEASNSRENAYRSENPTTNELFSRHFFAQYPEKVGDFVVNGNLLGLSDWWTKALRFALRVYGAPQAELESRAVWDFAVTNQHRFPVGGLDLVPLHSARDGFSGHLLKVQLTEHEMLLRDTSLASIRLALRIAPDLVFVASSTGTRLVSKYANDLGVSLVEDWLPEVLTTPFSHLASLYRQGQGTKVLCFRRQVFSGSTFLPRGFTQRWMAEVGQAATNLQ